MEKEYKYAVFIINKYLQINKQVFIRFELVYEQIPISSHKTKPVYMFDIGLSLRQERGKLLMIKEYINQNKYINNEW